jgi:hypothetical protein
MWKLAALGALVSAAVLAQPVPAIGSIDFFGHQGIDVQAVLAKLPIKSGDSFGDLDSLEPLVQKIEDAVSAATGRPPTDVSVHCCDATNRFMGYPGKPTARSPYFPIPQARHVPANP